MNNKIFISGRISGIRYDYAKKNFAKAEKVWSKRGYDVVNPIKLCNPNWSWLHCMIVCLWHLIQCRFVYFMPNYKFSRGAKIELKVAQFLNKLIFIDN